MAEDKIEPRELNWRQLLPWTALFQGFRISLDLNKLLLAAGGILAMAFLWWFWSIIFNYSRPAFPSPAYSTADAPGEKDSDRQLYVWNKFKRDREKWDLMHEMAGDPDSKERVDALDLADSYEQAQMIEAETQAIRNEIGRGKTRDQILLEVQKGQFKFPYTNADGKRIEVTADTDLTPKAMTLYDAPLKPAGKLRTWPWFENRGPNPYLLATGQAQPSPWQPGHFLEWFLGDEVPVLLEPLRKFLLPIIYFFNPSAGPLARVYLILVILSTIAVWALFGGAITRIAAVQAARGEKIGIREAFLFTVRRYFSYVAAPIFPLLLVVGIVIVMILFGYLHMIPVFGDIVVDGLLWWLMVLAGLGMAVVLVGLIGWPLMAATISAEGTDFWEGVSRAYSYVYQAFWHYLFYGIVALLYGAAVVFFVGFMGSAMVYFAKWGVSQTPGINTADRNPSYLFVYAPTSFNWRGLLLEGARVDGQNVAPHGEVNPVLYERYLGNDPTYNEKTEGKKPKDTLTWYNKLGAVLVAFWLYLIFLLVLGFGYSYFWSSSTIIYLLMRRKVDDAEMDEVYLEEEDQELPYGGGAPKPAAPPAPAPAPAGTSPLQMVEAPTLRTPPPPPPRPSPANEA
ncbi:MAG TPA: hypothetical protein VFA26_12110, partial [Gemmataceae bacterium]|nr:hypothetical protein [Gemmataceae bacterium]